MYLRRENYSQTQPLRLLHDFLRISRKDILTHAGRISAQFLQNRLWKSYISDWFIYTFECSFIHLEIVQIMAAQPRTPVVGTDERTLTM